MKCVGCGLDRPGSGQGQVAGICECGDELSSSIKCEEFLDWLRTTYSFSRRALLYGVSRYMWLINMKCSMAG